MLPNYLVIGAPKCGTSSLCHLLGQHPDVFMSDPKEIHFFGRNDPKKTMPWYQAHFDGATQRAVGEGSTSYTHPDIIEKCATEIAAQIPQCRLIYMVRNPLRRLESDWKMRAHEGWAKGASINESVELQPTLVTQGAYWNNINVYRKLFSDEQILIVFLEDFSRDPKRELTRCFEHLGVPPWQEVENADRPRNASAEFSKDRRVGQMLRESRYFKGLRARTPPWLLKAGKALLIERQQYEIEWHPDMRSKVVSSLQDDARCFLEYCGKPPDYWRYS